MQSRTLPSRVTFISHARTLAIKRESFPVDEALLDGEIEKIRAVGWIAPQAQISCCGPETRTQQTAAALGLTPAVEVGLSDVDYGSWRGKGIDELQMGDSDGLAEWLTDPFASPHGGETLMQLIARVEKWMSSKEASGHTLAVTHPTVIRAAILTALQAPPSSFWRVEIAPLSISDLRFNGRVWIVRSTGCLLSKSV